MTYQNLRTEFRYRIDLRTSLFLGAFILLLRASEAWSGCPELAGGESALGQKEATERLGFIRERLAEEARHARQWSFVWGLSYGVLTGGQFALIAASDERGEKIDMVVGAATSAVGLAAILILPLAVMTDQKELEQRLKLASLWDDPCATLKQAEELLMKDAEDEAAGKSWLMHGANVLLNAAAGLVLWLGFDRWESALITFASGTALGEVMIFTQPDSLEEDLQEYRRGKWSSDAPAPTEWQMAPWLIPEGGGIQLVAHF